MPRRSGGGGGRSFGGSRGGFSSPGRSGSFAQSPRASPSRLNEQHAAPPRQGMFGGGGLGSMLATGMAFGAGSEVAHQAVRGMMGGGDRRSQELVQQGGVDQYVPTQSTQMAETSQPMMKCQWENEKFIQCIKNNPDTIGTCQEYFDKIRECEKSNPY